MTESNGVREADDLMRRLVKALVSGLWNEFGDYLIPCVDRDDVDLEDA